MNTNPITNEILDEILDEIAKKNAEQEIELLEDGPYKPTKEIVGAYSKKHGFDIKQAKKRLEKNYQAEYESVDGREMAMKNVKHLRMLGPKVNSMELREQSHVRRITSLESQLKAANEKLNSLEDVVDEMESLRKTMKDTIKTILANSGNQSIFARVKSFFKNLF